VGCVIDETDLFFDPYTGMTPDGKFSLSTLVPNRSRSTLTLSTTKTKKKW